MTSFKAKEKMLVILCNLETADRMRQFILVSQLKSIRFVNFEILVIGRCYESTSLVHNFDGRYYFFVIAGRKESLSCSDIPQRKLITSSCHKSQSRREKINALKLLTMMESHLSFLVNSKIKKFDIAIIGSRQYMVIFQSFDAFNVVSVGVRVRVYYLTYCYIELSQNKIIAS